MRCNAIAKYSVTNKFLLSIWLTAILSQNRQDLGACGENMNIINALTGLALGAGLFLSGCAEQAQRVPATYIPSIVYRGANCQELYNERVTLAGYVRHVTAEQRKVAQSDAVFFTTSALIFWPAIFALPISVDQSAQLASARGHYDAISKAMVEQGCVVGAGPAKHAPGVMGKGYAAPSRVQTYSAPQPGLPNWKRYPGQFPPL